MLRPCAFAFGHMQALIGCSVRTGEGALGDGLCAGRVGYLWHGHCDHPVPAH